MNPILRKSSTLGKIILKPKKLSSGGKKFVPCSSRCICLIYLDLNEIRSQNYAFVWSQKFISSQSKLGI